MSGQPDASELVGRLFATDPDEVMPPRNSNSHVTPEQRELLNNVPESGVPSGGGQYRIADPSIPIGSAQDKAKHKDLEATLAKAKEEETKLSQAPEVLAEHEGKERDLVAQKVVEWTPVKPTSAISTGRLKFSVLDDLSFSAEGTASNTGDSTVTLPAPAEALTGMRLETAPDPRLPWKGAGHGDSGNAVLTGMKLTVGRKEYPFSDASATYSRGAFPRREPSMTIEISFRSVSAARARGVAAGRVKGPRLQEPTGFRLQHPL